MQKEVLYGLIGLLIGVLLTVFVASSSVNNQNLGIMRMLGMGETADLMMGNHSHDDSEMDEMRDSLVGKTGDTFDKTFIAAMITHHEDAIDMAEEAKKSAKHQEIKDLADDIIEAQTKEINQMKDWQKAWGY